MKLRHIEDSNEGILRKKKDDAFYYTYPSGKLVKDQNELERISALGIPPIWERVWICNESCGYLQATGYDAKGRKQYIYHPQYVEQQQQKKFDSLIDFAVALPQLRKQAEKDLEQKRWTKEKVVALAILLLDEGYIRIGNKNYTRQNKTYGLTTLRKKHIHIDKKEIDFTYKAKSGKMRTVAIQNDQLVKLIRKCSELPGHRFLTYRQDGKSHPIDSQDVNSYIQEVTGGPFSSKYFRTWGANVLVLDNLDTMQAKVAENQRLNPETTLVRLVAKQLNNTVSVCRTYYIHPKVLKKALTNTFDWQRASTASYGLDRTERTVLAMLDPEAL